MYIKYIQPMLSKISACPLASLIIILVIVTVIFDTYVMFGVLTLPNNAVFLAFIFAFIILYALFTIWLANRTCYRFVWVSWLIIIYLVYSIIDSIVLIINPEHQKNAQKRIDEIVNEPIENPPTNQ